MRGDALVYNQRLITQAVFAIAKHIDGATAYQLTPVPFADLPSPAVIGMVACITDYGGPGTPNWGQVASGGGTEACLVWYNGANWTIVGK